MRSAPQVHRTSPEPRAHRAVMGEDTEQGHHGEHLVGLRRSRSRCEPKNWAVDPWLWAALRWSSRFLASPMAALSTGCSSSPWALVSPAGHGPAAADISGGGAGPRIRFFSHCWLWASRGPWSVATMLRRISRMVYLQAPNHEAWERPLYGTLA